jgi:type I restriction enzyme S subunit
MNTMKEAIIAAPDKTTGKFKQTEVGLIPEDWEVCHLTKAVSYIHGKAHERDVVEDGKFILVNSKFISSSGAIKKHSSVNRCVAKTGDVLTVLSDLPNGKALAKCFLVKHDDLYAVNQRICIWRPNQKSISGFIYHLLNRYPYFLAFDDGVSQTHILNRHIEGCKIFLPPLPEQTAIAQALSDADALIASLEKLIEKKKRIKQGAMQELLSSTDANGKLKEGWVKIRLGEILDFSNGRPLENYVRKGGNFKLITLDSIDIEGNLKSTHKQTDYNDEFLCKGDIVAVLSDIAHARLLGLCDVIPKDGVYVLNQRMGRLRFSKEFDPYFMRLIINSNQEYFRNRGQGSSQRHIYKKDFDELEVHIPPLEMQNTIVKQIFDLHSSISILKEKLSKMSSLKQGMMQNLLTGKIRLV